ncbi:KUP/HAK/KT family potassium transporter [Furfurilactobacillus siliginis]|uniref:Probable potassium transport system protein Kup n=1 Tax=Furfurilactobacillus siliginis TaxID=348151 RepID=A0A0R2L279_9LACO|nr:KUP/HAK/KT family potassium transporter [Furfurilactobacillus siliginis]KRN95665.1 potassium transport protein [Furfurilactobacillus siliginis]GEK29585.1 putative potassium transport system protein kup [Furfurilactobacillus siliginis]
MNPKARTRISAAGLLVTLGIVYGDIGTSPLYVMKTILADNGGLTTASRELITGSISLIFWTVMLLTTLKYVLIALRATNHGEGGIFALYTLVRHRARWLIVPALVGGAALLADGMLTPAVTVTTSIEGLKGIVFHGWQPVHNQADVIVITLVILSALFVIQRFGTRVIGRAFGPIMTIWFTFIGVVGLINTLPDLSILRALNPYYAVSILTSPDNKVGIFILGSVFLATTGAEALYSDVGHVGKVNIDGSWPYVFICLMFNYFGQGVWVMQHATDAQLAKVEDFNPFFEILPGDWRFVGIVLATLAAIIASQALITGSYTLVAEAVRLKLLPRLKINYPTLKHGQIYVPVVNGILWIACLGIVLYFRTSAHMEAAYGLAITVTMLMTTLLLYQYLRLRKVNGALAWLMVLFFGSLETMFFVSSMVKFVHGGYVTAILAGLILLVMYIWYYGNIIRDRDEFGSVYVDLDDYKDQLQALSRDESYPTFATNLVYMAKVRPGHLIKREMIYSILDKRPKRAQAYWFVTVNVTDDPYTAKYDVDMLGTDNVINVQLYLGFRREQRVNVYLRAIVQELIESGELPAQPQKYTMSTGRNVGDFSFVVIQEELSPDTRIHPFDWFIIQQRITLQNWTSSPASWFGLDFADVVVEHVPLILGRRRRPIMRRIRQRKDIPEVDDDEDLTPKK